MKLIYLDNLEMFAGQMAKKVRSMISKQKLGLDLVDNTPDMEKPVSAAQQIALESHDASENAHADIRKNTVWFGICGSRKSEAAKAVDLEGFILCEAAKVVVYFTFGNTAENITLNVNGTGAKRVLYKNQPVQGICIQAEWGTEFVYYAGAWRIMGDLAEKRADGILDRVNELESEVRSITEANEMIEITDNEIDGIIAGTYGG